MVCAPECSLHGFAGYLAAELSHHAALVAICRKLADIFCNNFESVNYKMKF